MDRLVLLLITLVLQVFAWDTSAGMCTVDQNDLTDMLDRKMHYWESGGFAVTPSKTTYSPGETITFTIRHMEVTGGRSKPFKGFLFYGEGAEGMRQGSFAWQVDANWEGGMPAECDDSRTTTHTAPNLKQKVTLQWTAPSEDMGDIVFKNMIYESRDFWNAPEVTLTFEAGAVPSRVTPRADAAPPRSPSRPSRDTAPARAPEASPARGGTARPSSDCMDDPTGSMAQAGTSCQQMLGFFDCDVNMRVLNPAAPDVLIGDECPASCGKCEGGAAAAAAPARAPAVAPARPVPDSSPASAAPPAVRPPPDAMVSPPAIGAVRPPAQVPARPPVDVSPPRPMPTAPSRPVVSRPTDFLVPAIGKVEELSTLATILAMPEFTAAAEALGGRGPFTMFAPTNEAFSAAGLDVTEVEAILEGLQRHVVVGSVMSSALGESQEFKNLLGEAVTVTKVGGTVNVCFESSCAQVSSADRLAMNGVIHSITAVLVAGAPAAAPACKKVGFQIKSKKDQRCLVATAKGKVALAACNNKAATQVFHTKKNDKGLIMFHTAAGECVNAASKLGQCGGNSLTAAVSPNRAATTYTIKSGANKCLVALKALKFLKCNAKVATHQFEVIPMF